MKPFLCWREDWLLGVDTLDSQHIAIATLLSRIFSEFEGGVLASRLNPQGHELLLELVKVTQRHFKFEEALMLTHDYPARAEHHREHLMLLAELRDLIREIEEGHKRFTQEALTSLKHWQIDHVLCNDREFAAHLHRIEAVGGRGEKRLRRGSGISRDGVGFAC